MRSLSSNKFTLDFILFQMFFSFFFFFIVISKLSIKNYMQDVDRSIIRYTLAF